MEKHKQLGIINIATLNCRNINKIEKRSTIEQWASKNKIKILGVTETRHAHSATEGGKKK